MPIIGEGKNWPKFHGPKWLRIGPLPTIFVAGDAGDSGLVVNRRSQNQFVA